MTTLKKFAMALLALSAVAFTAPQVAQAFPTPVYVSFNAQTAAIQVYNTTGYPIACVGQIAGIRGDGFSQYYNFTLPWIAPGTSQFAYVNNVGPYWFVNASGWADCGWTW